MSTFENRTELWTAAQQAIDRADDDLQRLGYRLSREEPVARIHALGEFLEGFGFEVEPRAGNIDSAMVACSSRLNEEDMRKGLQHGHVAIVASCETALISDLIASAAAAIGLTASLSGTYGRISLIAVQRADDLIALCDQGVFREPDCVFIFRGSSDGKGFQHTLANSGYHLAGTSIELLQRSGSELDTRALQPALDELLDGLDERVSINASAAAIEIRAPRSTTVRELADQVADLIHERAASSGEEVAVTRGPVLPEMLPSHVLARRVKTFTDNLKMKLDPTQKQGIGEPVEWGCVSHEVATAVVGYPVPDDVANTPGAKESASMIAKAVTGAGLDVLCDIEFRGYVDGERVRALRERGLERTPRRWLGIHPVQPRTDGGRLKMNVPDVIVRGPGLPEPSLKDLIDDEAS